MSPFVNLLLRLWVLAVQTFLIVMAVVAGFEGKGSVAIGCAIAAAGWLMFWAFAIFISEN